MLEIFKTNVSSESHAALLLEVLHGLFPEARFNFDLEDCDRILRAEAKGSPIPVDAILRTVRARQVQIEVLQDF